MGWDLELVIAGPPVGSARMQFDGRSGRAYKPTPNSRWQAWIAGRARKAWRRQPPLDEAVEVEVISVIARPQRLSRRADPPGRMLADRPKPDVDNAAKLAMDALVNAGVMVDDTRVVRLVAEKWYSAKGEDPCTEIRLRRVAA